MSSNIKITRICQHCGQEFIARTTVTKYCGDYCAKRAYKMRLKKQKIVRSNLETNDQRSIQRAEPFLQDYLTVQEVAVNLKCDQRTIYRMIYAGRLKAINLSVRKIRILKKNIDEIFSNPAEHVSLRPQTKKNSPFVPNADNCFHIGEILTTFNISERTLTRIIEKRGIIKYKIGRFVYLRRSKILPHLRKFVKSE